MHPSIRFKLHFGPYRTPKFRLGQKVQCAVRGEVRIKGISDARIAWPIASGPGGNSLPVYGALERAVRRESIIAVAHWWGVTGQTVTKWRRRLGVHTQSAGTSLLRMEHFSQPWANQTRRKAWAKARDPVRREKIAAAKRGKPRPLRVVEALRRANRGKKASKHTRAKMSATHKARGIRPPWLNPPWEAWEDELVRTISGTEAARLTGRTYSAVKNRRLALGLPDGRRKMERLRLGR